MRDTGSAAGWWALQVMCSREEERTCTLAAQGGCDLSSSRPSLAAHQCTCPCLQANCTTSCLPLLPAAAAKDGSDPAGSKQLRKLLVEQRRGYAPAVMMVAAVAAGQLRTALEFDGAPRLAVQGDVVRVKVMEAKTSLTGAVASPARAAAVAYLSHPDMFLACGVLAFLCRHRRCVPFLARCEPFLLPLPVPLPACLIRFNRSTVHAASACAAGLSKARQQLQVAGKVVVWLLHTANPDLIADRQLQLRGVIAVQGTLAAGEHKKVNISVSCPGRRATMKLDVRYF